MRILAARVRMITRDSKGNSTNIFSVADLTVDATNGSRRKGFFVSENI